MRKTAIAVVLASFVGVFGALQADHFIGKQAADKVVYSFPVGDSKVWNVDYRPGIAAAPFDFSAAAKRVSPSVVSVDQYADRQDFWTGQSLGVQKSGTGSGVIISSSGLIVTNNHVVSLEDGTGQLAKRVVVRTSDNHSYDAKVLGADARSDLAVLKIDATNLQPIDIGSSKDLAVGQWVLAAGNPLDLGDTVTVGIISSLGRDLSIGERGMVGAIQTDAAINPGNSGGALCNSQGQLIGINAALENPNGQDANVGIGFAIPVDRVKQVVDDIVKYGYVKYAGLGITYNPRWDGVLEDDNLRSQLVAFLHVSALPKYGVVVLTSTGAAAEAGIQKNDVIQQVDDVKIDSAVDLNKATISRHPGDKVKVTVWSNGKTSTKTVTMQELPRPL